MYDLSGLGARIRILRTEKGYTQDGFARELGVSPQAVSKWETGAGFPDIGTLPMIAAVLDTSIDALFGDMETAAPPAEELPPEPVPGEVQPVFIPAENAAAQDEGNAEKAKEVPGADDGAQNGEDFSGDAAWDDAQERSDTARDTDPDWAASVESITRQVETAVRDALKNVDFHGLGELGKAGLSRLGQLGGEITRTVSEAISRQTGDRGVPAEGGGELVWNGESIDSLELNLCGGAEVTVEPGIPGQWDVTADGSPEFLNSIRCIEDGNTLKVETGPVRLSRRSFFGGDRNTLTIRTGYTEGAELDVMLRGSGSLRCEPGFQSSRVTISGSGDAELTDMGNFTCQINGSGDLDFRTASNLNLTVRGSGDVNGHTISGVSEIKVYGSGDVNLQAVTGQLSCLSFGSGDIGINFLELEKFSVTSNGAGDVEVNEGRAGRLELSMHGAGDFDAAGLTVDELDARLNGAADASIGRVTGPSSEHVGHASSLHITQRG